MRPHRNEVLSETTITWFFWSFRGSLRLLSLRDIWFFKSGGGGSAALGLLNLRGAGSSSDDADSPMLRFTVLPVVVVAAAATIVGN